MSQYVQRVPLSDQLAEAVANAKDADEAFALLNAAAEGQLTEEMPLEEALRRIALVSRGIESIGD